MPSWRLNHPSTLVDGWAFNGTAASFNGRYPGTLVNAPTWAAGPRGRQCIEFDGDDACVNIGDVTELNAVSAFSICFWMNQDVLDAADIMFTKLLDANNRVQISNDAAGELLVLLNVAGSIYGHFDYSTVISAASWHHLAVVFDGTQTGNANRLVIYADGTPVTLAFNGSIPTTTADMAGADAYIGYTVTSFDGKLYDFRIHSVPLSRDEVISIIHSPVPVLA